MQYPRLKSFLDTEDKTTRYKLSILKQKSILHQNDFIQIGLKSSLIYDFYSSKYFLQLLLFFGNKTDQPISNFTLEYKGNPAIELYIQDKPKKIKEHTQYKERLILALPEPEVDPWITMNFHSQWFQVNSLLIPLNIVRFMKMGVVPNSDSPINDYTPFQNLFKYTEQSRIFKTSLKVLKSGAKDIEKHFPTLKKVGQGVYIGTFQLGCQSAKHLLVIQQKREQMKIEISSNQEKYLQSVLRNLEYLLGE